MDDQRLNEWAAAHRQGEHEALRPLVEALSRPLIAMAFRYVGDWDTARDLTQDTWVRVHRSLDAWDPSRPVRPWVFALHRNVCLDHLRKRSAMPSLDASVAEALIDPAPDPLRRLSELELVDRIRVALSGLSEIQRRVFTMVDLEELRPAEVAASIGMNPNTVRTTLHFARRKLARILGKEQS